MKKKLLSVLLCMAMTATLFAGCGQNGGADANADANVSADANTNEDAAGGNETTGYKFEIVSKGFQHQYWQAVLKGSQNKAAELGAKINFVGPDSESDIAGQVQMLQSAINAQPDAIGLAALDTKACLDAIVTAQEAGIPIVGFDSGVPGAPEGAIVANAATDNYAAGVLAAEETYKLIEAKLAAGVRIGVMGQDATAESIINRGLGFIDKMAELVTAKGLTVTVEGNDKYVADCAVTPVDGADVVIEVLVPSEVKNELSITDGSTLLNKADTICIYGSNQFSAENLVSADENIGRLGVDVVGVGFDSGATLKAAVASGKLAGAITQAPVAMGEKLVELLYTATTGGSVADVDTGCQWYTADNMNNEEIAQNLYD
ncbi:MAG: substrate-binding domain-containing protein [Roseburia sp.]|nr:substrate-binding domain-containing protein [Roseburia sp.]